MGEISRLNADNFAEHISGQSGKHIVLFSASWCMPCKRILPILAQFAKNNPEVAVGKVDRDESGSLFENFNIRSVPTLAIFSQGELLTTHVGVFTLASLNAMIATAA